MSYTSMLNSSLLSSPGRCVNMLHLLVLSVLVATTIGYRLTEYTGNRCTEAETGFHRLAGATACSKLNTIDAKSILVKVDNIYDDQHSVIVYENDDCTGSILGVIENMNGCLNLHGLNNVVGRSVKIIPGTVGSTVFANEGFETNYLYNLPAQDRSHIMVPIAHAFFRTVDITNHADDGTYDDEAFDIFITTELDHVLRLESNAAMPLTEFDSSESIHLERADLLERISGGMEGLEAVANSFAMQVSETMRVIYNSSAHLAQEVENTFKRAAERASSRGDFDFLYSQKNQGRLVRKLIDSAQSQGLTNAQWNLKDKRGRTWEVTLKMREHNEYDGGSLWGW
ncbi:similar to An11g06480 [Aspergillus luchuensis]|nr:similar to An11g06480 [Aspergillus luchuensis]